MFIFSKTKTEISTLALPQTLNGVCKNIIRDGVLQLKTSSGTVSTTRPAPRRRMRAAANITSKPVRVAEVSELDCKFIYKSGASRNCTNRV